MLVWFWLTKLKNTLKMILSVVFACFSLIVIYNELTVSVLQNSNLNIFNWIQYQTNFFIIHVIKIIKKFYIIFLNVKKKIKILAFIPLTYISFCAYYGLFHMKLTGLYGLYEQKQTDAPSLLFAAMFYIKNFIFCLNNNI